MSRLALYLLGPPRLERDSVPLEFDTRKILALVAYLAVTGGTHTREALITLLWPELEPSRARAVLRRNLSVLRKALHGEWLVVDRETIGLDPDADPSTGSGQAAWVDVNQFRQHLAACETHGHPPTEACPECLPLLEEAAALYRDHFLAGFTLRDSAAFDEWQFFQTEGLKDGLASMLVRLATYHTSQGDFEAAIGYARRWLALDSLHEPAHRHLMALYAQAGRHSAALRQYRECMRILEEELALSPSAETTALYKRIRAERVRPVEVEATAPTPPPSHTPLPAFLTEEEAPLAVERRVFVARERELARLDGYLNTALTGQGQVVFVMGGPGRGKTVLMHEFARRAMETHPDLLVASGNCNAYSGVGDPYLPFREALGMLTGDVEAQWAAGTVSREHAQRLWSAFPLAAQALVHYGPSLIGTILSDPALASRAIAVAPEGTGWLQELLVLSAQRRSGHGGLEQSAIFHQFTNVLRALAEAHPLLLMLDDVQWADSASIGLLFHLGRRLGGSCILIACAYRPEEVALGRPEPVEGRLDRHPLDKVLAEFKRDFGDVWVDLRQVDEMAGRSFVNAFLDTEPNRLGERFRDELFRHTVGHPLFTIEVLRAMQERGELVQDAEGRWAEGPSLDWERLPARVGAVIAERVGRLDEDLRDILAVASVEGEQFTAQVVAEVQDLAEREVLRALSQELAARHRLVREGGETQVGERFLSRYQFAHALFQEYLYRGLSAGERRLLHGEVAAALEGLYGDRTVEIVTQLAHHYDEAGRGEKAIEYALRAGDQARLAYANEEAIAYFSRVLALLGLSPTPFDKLRASFPAGSREGGWRLEALKGLGQVYYATGQLAEAEEHFQEAISLGREIGLAPRELVRLYHWLAEALWWQGRLDDQIHIGKESLALLGDDVESVEAALMNDAVAVGHWTKGNRERFREFTHRTAQFIQRLPYTKELRPVYLHISRMYSVEFKDIEKAAEWRQAFEQIATQHHDLRALGEIHWYAGLSWDATGDLHEAIRRYEQALELIARIGDTKAEGSLWENMGEAFLSLGDLQKAEEYARRGLETTKAVGSKIYMALAYRLIGQIALCRDDWEKAADACEKAVQLFRTFPDSWGEAWVTSAEGRGYLAQGDRAEALGRFQEAVALVGIEEISRWYIRYPLFVCALCGLEQAHEDPAAFRAFCRHFQEDHPEVGDSPFIQWFLEPAALGAVRDPSLQHDEFAAPLSPDWEWQDPFGDSSFTVRDGLEIHAANGRDLWHINLSAPRMLRPVATQGDFAVQTVCIPIVEEKPAIGGLLLWKDRENYLRLDRGVMGERDILFGGCLQNQDVIIGRGQLSQGPSGQAFLRLERMGDRVDALCSADGKSWFTAGYVVFPVKDPIQVGLHAIGNIDRSIYHGAYPDGTAIRFESFTLWELNH